MVATPQVAYDDDATDVDDEDGDNAGQMYQYDGVYPLGRAAAYLTVGLPEVVVNRHPASIARLRAWKHRGLLYGRLQVSRGRYVLNFDDMVTAQALFLWRAAGFSLAAVEQIQRRLARVLDVERPFTWDAFWSADGDLLNRAWHDLREHGIRATDRTAMTQMQEWLPLVRARLRFAPSGQAASWEIVTGITTTPVLQFGAPCLDGTRFRTATLWSYVAAGDSVQSTADSYEIEVEAVELAVQFEERIHAIYDPDRHVPR